MDIPKLKKTSRAREYNTLLTHNEPPSLSSIFLMENLIGGLTKMFCISIALKVVDGSLWGFSTILV